MRWIDILFQITLFSSCQYLFGIEKKKGRLLASPSRACPLKGMLKVKIYIIF
tara:strand:+ start:685 stop:840 length:156 start_codon:yes stop_codon:yes gene_type:complete